MASNAIHAKNGSATWDGTSIGDISDISIDKTANVETFANSSTNGQISRRVGHKDVTGSFTIQANALGALKTDYDANNAKTLVIYSDGSEKLFNGTAVIIDITWGVAVSGGMVEATVNWGQRPA